MHGQELRQTLGRNPQRLARHFGARHPAGAGQRVEERPGKRLRFVHREKASGDDRIVELVRIARVGTHLIPHARDCGRVERADVARR